MKCEFKSITGSAVYPSCFARATRLRRVFPSEFVLEIKSLTRLRNLVIFIFIVRTSGDSSFSFFASPKKETKKGASFEGFFAPRCCAKPK
jgi:hypothetical protein